MRTCPTSCGGGRHFNFYITLRAVAETARNAVRSPSARPASCFALRLRGRSTAGDVFVLRDSASHAPSLIAQVLSEPCEDAGAGPALLPVIGTRSVRPARRLTGK